MNDNNSNFASTSFIDAQKQKIATIVAEVFRNQNQQSTSFSITSKSNYRFIVVVRFAKNIDFFDSIYKNSNNFLIVNVDCYIFYRDIYVFYNRLRNLIKSFIEKKRVTELILEYLCNSAFIQYFTKLFELEKNLLCDAIVEQ